MELTRLHALIVIGVTLLSVGIGNAAFVFSNQSELIWREQGYYGSFRFLQSDIGSSEITLPKSSNNYIFIAETHAYTSIDITLRNLDTYVIYNYYLYIPGWSYSLNSGIRDDSVILKIPSGD